MHKIKTWEKFMESISRKKKINDIHVPELDIYEQMQFLYDIIDKNKIDISCKLYKSVDGEKIEHNLIDNFLDYVSNENYDYNLAILIKCNQAMSEMEFESCSKDLEEFCKHLEFSLDNYKIFYKIRHARRKNLEFYVYIVDIEHTIHVRRDKEKLMTELRSKLKKYKISENGDFSIKIKPRNFMFNSGAKEEISDIIEKLREEWNLTKVHLNNNEAAYVSLDYSLKGRGIIYEVTKNFGLADEN